MDDVKKEPGSVTRVDVPETPCRNCEATARDNRILARQNAEFRVDLERSRAGARELEVQLRAATGEVGRAVVARIVAHVPEGVADVLTGARHIDESMQAALDAAVEAVEVAERERDEARAEVERLAGMLTPRPDAGLAGLAEREAVEPVKVEPATPADGPPAPDLRRGDWVLNRNGYNVQIEAAPYMGPGDVWWVRCADVTRPVSLLDLSTRVRTWQPGEVVPHAPEAVKRRRMSAFGADLVTSLCPLAEPWTQTGV